jgi:glutamyl-Q tRNA(Asp) synthetase
LHLGSLLAAAGSYLSARSQAGRWLVRIEDLDRAREVPGAAQRILRTLDLFGFEWDGPVEYQSHRLDRYDSALAALQRNRQIYPCSCSRSQLSRLARTSDGEPVYPGTCRSGPAAPGQATALRFHTGEPGRHTRFHDRLQGWYEQDVASEVGDFVVRRRDGHAAYQLAVVVDDAAQGVTEVVRGCDLLDNTPRQILLQHALGLPTPEYCHLPLITEADGSKLAKRRHSVPLDPLRAPELLHAALTLLGQSPPADLRSAALATLWEWAFAHWSRAPLRGVKTISL